VDVKNIRCVHLFSGTKKPVTLIIDDVRLRRRIPPAAKAAFGAFCDGDDIIVQSPGKWRLEYWRGGCDAYRWYDLSRDPAMKTNLAAGIRGWGLDLTGLKTGKAGSGDSWCVGPGSMEILESGPSRVRLRFEGADSGYGSGRSWAHNSVHTITHTVYPDGRICTLHRWQVKGEPLAARLSTLQFVMAPTSETKALLRKADSGEGNVYHLHWNDGPERFMDALLVPAWGPAGRHYGGENAAGFFRSSVDFFKGELKEPLQPGFDKSWAYMLHVGRDDLNSQEAADAAAFDYLKPGKVDVKVGELVTDDEGDLNGDGFNEAQGCYVLRAKDYAVDFVFDPGDAKRFSPTFKVIGAGKNSFFRAFPADHRVDNLSYLALLKDGPWLPVELGRAEDGGIVRVAQEVSSRIRIVAAPYPE
jgi:hypothetical protein